MAALGRRRTQRARSTFAAAAPITTSSACTRARRPELLCINLSAASRADVDRLHRRAADAGAPRIDPPAAIGEPGGGYGFAFADPEGRVVRVIAEDARHADACVAPDRPVQITHVVLNTPRQEEAAAFWVKALGFEVSDRSLLTFIRCNADHHSIAFHPGESATLHHIAFEMADIDSVMRGAGRMRDAGHPIEWGPGRHGPGNNVFAYFVGPGDFVIEYTAEVEKVDRRLPGAHARGVGLPARPQRPVGRHPAAQPADEGGAEANRVRRRPVPPIK